MEEKILKMSVELNSLIFNVIFLLAHFFMDQTRAKRLSKILLNRRIILKCYLQFNLKIFFITKKIWMICQMGLFYAYFEKISEGSFMLLKLWMGTKKFEDQKK